MNLGEFRRLTASLPDDTEIVAHGGDLEWYDTDMDHVFDAVEALEVPAAISLIMGQVVNLEMELDARVDVAHIHGDRLDRIKGELGR